MCAISEEIREEGREEGILLGEEIAFKKMLIKLTPEEIINIGYERSFVMNIVNSLR